jgi:hypothetical protein
MTDSRESCWKAIQVPDDQTVVGRITPDMGKSIGPSALGNRTWGLGWLMDESQFLRRQSSGMELMGVFVLNQFHGGVSWSTLSWVISFQLEFYSFGFMRPCKASHESFLAIHEMAFAAASFTQGAGEGSSMVKELDVRQDRVSGFFQRTVTLP